MLNTIRFHSLLLTLATVTFVQVVSAQTASRPNILFAIADDQSYPYASAYGTSGINTPAFDRLANSGVLFHNAFVPAPQCSPCRAAILTGRNIWQLEEAGTHGSYFPRKFPVFTRALEDAGYHVGFTGKPWSPGNWEDQGWERNPVGDEYSRYTLEKPTGSISQKDYARNFADFLSKRGKQQPFFFWYGAHEPHRTYEYGSGLKNGKNLKDAFVPPFLPDSEVTRNDVMDYVLEIEWFDKHLGLMLEMLEEKGELENTIVVVTADNGMPFPYAKANLQEYGTHVPLVISGPAFFAGARNSLSPVSLIDLAPTFLEFAGVDDFPGIAGKSLQPHLIRGYKHRDWVLTGRERHTHARPDNLGYPSRSIRTAEFHYIWNIKPERWPAGIPPPTDLEQKYFHGTFSTGFKSIGLGFADIDDGPSKEFMLNNRHEYPEAFFLGFQKRPAEQLYDVRNDPWCLHNLAMNPHYDNIKSHLRMTLMKQLHIQGDPRVMGNGDIFESYPRFGSMRYFPGFKERGEYNPAFSNRNYPPTHSP